MPQALQAADYVKGLVATLAAEFADAGERLVYANGADESDALEDVYGFDYLDLVDFPSEPVEPPPAEEIHNLYMDAPQTITITGCRRRRKYTPKDRVTETVHAGSLVQVNYTVETWHEHTGCIVAVIYGIKDARLEWILSLYGDGTLKRKDLSRQRPQVLPHVERYTGVALTQR